jgi:REP element-mobilizing transposase RayT
MARRLRYTPPNTPVEITQRILHGRLLLRPSEELRQIILGVLGRAQRLYDMPIHSYVFLSNHYHLIVTPRDAHHLAAFMAYVSGNLAREIARLYGWPEKVWGRRYSHVPIVGEAAQVDRLRYVLAQGVKEGLVERATDWPGVNSLRTLLDGTMRQRGTWYDRSAAYRARRTQRRLEPQAWTHEETVVLSRLPALAALSDAQHVAFVAGLVSELELEAARERERPAAGAGVIAQKAPETETALRRKSPIPLVHAATRELRRAFKAAYRAFVDAYVAASKRFRDGFRDAVFPEGSFPPPQRFVVHSTP